MKPQNRGNMPIYNFLIPKLLDFSLKISQVVQVPIPSNIAIKLCHERVKWGYIEVKKDRSCQSCCLQ